MVDLVTDKPTLGKSLGFRVGGSWATDPTSGLWRKRFLRPGWSEAQHTSPPEEVVGANPSGIRGKGIVYHLSSYGSNTYALVEVDDTPLQHSPSLSLLLVVLLLFLFLYMMLVLGVLWVKKMNQL